jgi:branched-chain amino acid transport system substrate-binding protein
MNEAGVTEALYEGINTGDKDFSALIAKMKEAGVSIVYYGGLHTEAGLIMRQMKDQGLAATLMSGDGIVSNELASIAGDAVDGTLMTFAPDPRKNPAAAELVEKFRAAGFEPEAYTLYAYAAVQVIAEGAKAAGGVDPQAIAEAMKAKGPFKTAIGELGFDEKGDITRPDYVMYTWKKGEDGKFSYFQNE